MAESPYYIGETVFTSDGHWWYVTEMRPDGAYGYRVTGPTGHTRYSGGGSGHHHPVHASHHHGQHHHRRAAAPPHHADHSTPGSTRRTPSATPGRAMAGPASRPGNTPTQVLSVHVEHEAESHNVSESLEEWEKKYPRRIMAVQGVIDIAAGSAGTVTTIALVCALAAPETLGLSLALGVAVLAIYGITRGTGQVAAGVTELATAGLGSKQDVEHVGEGIERFKTLTSISSYVSIGMNRFYHQRTDWKRAKYASDAETIIGGVAQGKLGDLVEVEEDALGVLKLSKGVQRARSFGEGADTTDKVNSGFHDALDGYVNARQYLDSQNKKRQAAARKLQQSTAPAAHQQRALH